MKVARSVLADALLSIISNQGDNQMNSRGWVRAIVGALAILGGGVSAAQAQSVTFVDVSDAAESKFFDAAASQPDPLDSNKLVIGFHSGRDSVTWKQREFRASTAAFSYTTATDTISFRIEAPAGFYVSKVTYQQRGTGSMYRTGKAAGAATWVVGGIAAELGVFGTNPTLSGTIDLTGKNLTSLSVSITDALFAYATPSLGSATVEITGADVTVELLPLIP
jgi:hypothetical protein